MKKIFLIISILLFSLPLPAIESREIEEIIQSIVGPDSQAKEKKDYQKNADITAVKKSADTIYPTETKDSERKEEKVKSFPSPDEALLKSGIELFEASLYENSKQKFNELKSKYPESPYIDISSIWLSKIYNEQNNLNEAVSTLNAISQESGEYPSALYYIAEINLKKGDEPGAIEYFYRVASLFPDHELADDSLIHISRLYLKNGKGNQSLEAVIKVVKNYEKREMLDDAYYILAQVFEKDPMLKDFGVAGKIYRIFIKKAEIDKAANFYNSPLLDRVKSNLKNIENTFYSKGFTG